MFTHIDLQMETVFVLAAAGALFQLFLRLKRPSAGARQATAEDYLYKIARITGASEYEIFRKSAENWPVSESMIEEHFREYLLHQATPYYVNAFVRKHKHKIDELRLPPF